MLRVPFSRNKYEAIHDMKKGMDIATNQWSMATAKHQMADQAILERCKLMTTPPVEEKEPGIGGNALIVYGGNIAMEGAEN